jgi:hypothetical protein
VPRTVHDPDRGAGITEYAAVILLVAGITATVVFSGADARVAAFLGRAVDAVPGAAAAPGTATGPVTAAAPSGTGTGDPPPRPADDGAVAGFSDGGDVLGYDPSWWDGEGTWGAPSDDMPLFGFQDRGGYRWDCGRVFDFACKLGGGAASGAVETWGGIADTACLLHLCSHSGFRDNWAAVSDGITHVFTRNPLTTAGEMWDGFIEPFEESAGQGGFWNNGGYAAAGTVGGILRPFRALPDDDGGNGGDSGDDHPTHPEPNGHVPGSGMGDAELPPDDPYQAFRWLRERVPPPADLTDGERSALRFYSSGTSYGHGLGNGYEHINRHLRGQDPPVDRTPEQDAQVLRAIDDIDAVMARHRLPEPVIAYRVAGDGFLDALGVDAADPAAIEGLIGRTLREDGYLSTSADRYTAAGARGDVEMRIRVPEGYAAVDMADDATADYPEEAELLLDRGARYVVHGARTDDTGVVHLDVEIVPEGWTRPGDWAPQPLED